MTAREKAGVTGGSLLAPEHVTRPAAPRPRVTPTDDGAALEPDKAYGAMDRSGERTVTFAPRPHDHAVMERARLHHHIVTEPDEAGDTRLRRPGGTVHPKIYLPPVYVVAGDQ